MWVVDAFADVDAVYPQQRCYLCDAVVTEQAHGGRNNDLNIWLGLTGRQQKAGGSVAIERRKGRAAEHGARLVAAFSGPYFEAQCLAQFCSSVVDDLG